MFGLNVFSSTGAAILGTILVSAMCSLAGSFLILQRRSLIVDMLGHAVFPGVILGFLFAGLQRSQSFFFVGAGLSVFFAFALFRWMASNDRVGDDASTAIVLSGMFALGSVLLSVIQQNPSTAQAGLNTFLVGQAALISENDVYFLLLIFLCTSLVFCLNAKKIKVWAFDASYAQVSGLKSKSLMVLVYLLITIIVFFAVQTVGVVLASALFVLSPLAVLLWVKRFESLLFFSVLYAVLCSWVGSFGSSLYENIPTGAAVIFVLFLFFLLSWAFSPSGSLAAMIRNKKIKNQRLTEDLLKSWYYFYEKSGTQDKSYRVLWKDVIQRLDSYYRFDTLTKTSKLLKVWSIHVDSVGYQLNALGFKKAESLVRRHRLWEAYLVQKMGFSPDHVHEDAERVEHYIGEDLESRIELEVDTLIDPHGKPIPESQSPKGEGESYGA